MVCSVLVSVILISTASPGFTATSESPSLGSLNHLPGSSVISSIAEGSTPARLMMTSSSLGSAVAGSAA